MTPEAKQLLIDKPELCKEIYLAGFQKWWVGDRGHTEKHLKQSFDDLVKEHTAKDWEILSFKGVQFGPVYKLQPDGKYKDVLSFPYRKMIEEVENRTMIIHSVRRLSDNEVFTEKEETEQGKIKRFGVVGNDMMVECESKYAECDVNINDLAKRTLLFITEDGKDYYKGDTLIPVRVETLTIEPETNIYYGFIPAGHVVFSTREAAEQWVEDHKPKYSKRQLLDIANNNYATDIRKELTKLFES